MDELWFVRWKAPDGAEEILTVNEDNLLALFEDLRADAVTMFHIERVTEQAHCLGPNQ